MAETIKTIGVIGLGNMGSGMAASLARAGFEVCGFDTAAASAEKTRAAGVTPVTSIAEVAERAEAILTMLPDTPDVEAVLLGADGVHRYARPGTLIIDSSTIAPALTDRAATEFTAAGFGFIDAPVGRSPAEAAAGKLLFMVGATPENLIRAQPLLDAMGDTILHCGAAGTGIRMKLVLNLLSQSTCQLSAEVTALGLKLGLELDTLLGVLGGGLGSNGFITRYWPVKVLAGDTTPGFAIRLSAKDLRLASEMAAQAEAPIPTGSAAAAAVNRASIEHGDLDVSGLLAVACANAGVTQDFGAKKPLEK
jgi:4-hydroxybutyrate dehydrogenase/sulfolactaldehyde 3-reductase